MLFPVLRLRCGRHPSANKDFYWICSCMRECGGEGESTHALYKPPSPNREGGKYFGKNQLAALNLISEGQF